MHLNAGSIHFNMNVPFLLEVISEFKKKLLFDPTQPKRERYFQNLKITSERIVSQGKIVLCPMVTLGLQQIQKTNLKIILGKLFPFFRDFAGGSKNDCPRYTAV